MVIVIHNYSFPRNNCEYLALGQRGAITALQRVIPGPGWEHNGDQACSCPRGWRLSYPNTS